MSAIETRGLTKYYGRTLALDGATLNLEPNKIIGLLGRNGAGKTTLLNIVANKLFATSGDVLVFGEPATENARAQARIFYMTELNLYPLTMRVRDAVRWAGEFYPGFDAAYAASLSAKFALDVKKKVRELSTGYTSIFKAILALASGADILLFDEPVLGLDANHRALLYREMLARYAEKPCTVVISTHLIDEVAEVLEEAVIIRQGRVILHQSVEDILRAACTVQGAAATVDGFVAGRPVAATQTMGRFKSATLRESLSEADAARARELGLDIAKPSLQQLFIDLTND
jgi:ABC-2 type transport system ATP-binding protein